MANFLRSKKLYILLLFLQIALVLVWGLLFNYNEFFKYNDSMDYSQMGREIARGNGFSTLQVFPGHLRYMKDRDLLNRPHWPNLYRFPLPTISNGLFQLVLDDPLKAGIIQSGFWMLLTVPLVFLILKKIAGIPSGIIGGFVFFFDSLHYSYSGLSETLVTFWLMLIIYVLFYFKKGNARYICLGVFTGLLFLSRTVFFFLVPVLIVYFIADRVNRRKILLFVLLFSIVISGWLVRNYNLTDSPFFSFMNLRNFTYLSADPFCTIDMEYSLKKIISENKHHILEKIRKNLLNFFNPFFWNKLLSPFGILLFISGCLTFFDRNRERRRLFFIALILLVINFLFYIPFLFLDRFFVPFKPLILIVFLASLSSFLEFLKERKYISGVLIYLLILCVPVSLVYAGKVVYRMEPNEDVLESLDFFERLKTVVPEDGIVLSDVSPQIALFSGRKAIRLPFNPGEIKSIDSDYIRIDYIIISKDIASKQGWDRYRELARKDVLSGIFSRVEDDGNFFIFERIHNRSASPPGPSLPAHLHVY